MQPGGKNKIETNYAMAVKERTSMGTLDFVYRMGQGAIRGS
jgi:hypothetical protein